MARKPWVPRQPEKRLENQILDWLNEIEGVFAFKVNNHAVYDPIAGTFRKNMNPHVHKGVHDIIGVYKGKFFSIEVKWDKNRPTKEQKTFLKNIRLHGGSSWWSNDLTECKLRFIREFGKIKYKTQLLFEEEL